MDHHHHHHFQISVMSCHLRIFFLHFTSLLLLLLGSRSSSFKIQSIFFSLYKPNKQTNQTCLKWMDFQQKNEEENLKIDSQPNQQKQQQKSLSDDEKCGAKFLLFFHTHLPLVCNQFFIFKALKMMLVLFLFVFFPNQTKKKKVIFLS